MIFDKDWIRTFMLEKIIIILHTIGINTEKKQLQDIFCPNVETSNPDIIEMRRIFENLVNEIDRGIKDKAIVLWNTVNKLNPIPYVPRIITTASSIIYEVNKWKKNMKDLHNLTNKLSGVMNKISNVSNMVSSNNNHMGQH